MIFKNITLIDENMVPCENMFLATRDNKIEYIGREEPKKDYGRVIDGKNRLLIPAFYNAHTHSPMQLLRGYGENLSLMDWLFKRIFPFEAQLNSNDIYFGALMHTAEMARFGIVGATDMYKDGMSLCRAFADGGVKGNISTGCTCFDDREFSEMHDYEETLSMISEYKGYDNGRIMPEFSLHAEYTSTPKIVETLANTAKRVGTRMNVHVSETENEVRECKERRDGKSPVKYFADLGFFDVPSTAAHCVHIDDEDIEILKSHRVSVATCPKSNLKLASGVCPADKLLKKGVNLALGTDGTASNNNLNMLEEIKFFALIHKGISADPKIITPAEALYAATRAGALSQGREDCGILKEGFRADIAMLDISDVYMKPVHNILNNLIYSAAGTDVCMTICDGKILYENGEYKAVDIERAEYEVEKSRKRILNELS